MKPTSYFSLALKLSKPFRSRGHEATIALIRTSSTLRRGIDLEVKKEGISSQQFNILRILRGSNSPLPTMEVSSRMIEVEPGVTKLLGKLQKRGLVVRERSPEDARLFLCSITRDGLEMLDRLDEPVAHFEEKALSKLSDEQLKSLIAILEQL